MGKEVAGLWACPVGYRLTLPLWCPAGWCAFFVAGSPCLQLTFFPPSPRPALAERSSRREGGDFLFSYARGFAPCIPGAESGRRGLNLRWRCPAGGLPSGTSEQGAKPARKGLNPGGAG